MAHARKKKGMSTSEFEHFKFDPKTQAQAEARNDFEDGKNLVLTGFAGTGKTYLAIALALQAYLDKEIERIVVFRSAVTSRDIGFLPGTEEEKMEVFEKAIRSNFNKLLHNGSAYDTLKQKGIVTFNSTSFERGTTYDHALVIVDEIQNLSFQEIDTLVTRLSSTSRIILCGDTRQTDLDLGKSGYYKMEKTVKKLSQFFSHIEFGVNDIVRGPLVKAWIVASSELDQKGLEVGD